jgi:hypothetical protein
MLRADLRAISQMSAMIGVPLYVRRNLRER